MLRIRFSRVGKKNAPSFRLVLTPKQSPPKGKFLEILGFYNPRTKEKGVEKERVLHWIKQGAQPSDTAHNFLIKEGVIEGKKLSVHSTAKRKKEEAIAKKTTADGPPTTEQPASKSEEKVSDELTTNEEKIEVDSGEGNETPTKETTEDSEPNKDEEETPAES